MDRIEKENYEKIPWSNCNEVTFTKPKFEEIERLKQVPMKKRDYRYSEFYELQTYIDLIEEIKPSVLLDVGAGCGNLSYIFQCLGWKVVSCDMDFEGFALEKNCFFKTDLNQKFPFDGNSFDCVVSKQVIEHLDNPRHFIREAKRLLRPGGVIIFSTPNITSLTSRLSFLLRGSLTHFENYWREHRSILHYAQLKSFLEEEQFKKIEFSCNIYRMYNFNSMTSGKKKKFLVPLLKSLSANDKVPLSCKFGDALIVRAFLEK